MEQELTEHFAEIVSVPDHETTGANVFDQGAKRVKESEQDQALCVDQRPYTVRVLNSLCWICWNPFAFFMRKAKFLIDDDNRHHGCHQSREARDEYARELETLVQDHFLAHLEAAPSES